MELINQQNPTNICKRGTTLYPSGKFATVEVPKWQQMDQCRTAQASASWFSGLFLMEKAKGRILLGISKG